MTILTLSKIKRIAIVDDDAAKRDSMAEVISDANYEPIKFESPLTTLAQIKRQIKQKSDAAIFDHRLAQSNYAHFKGAKAVAELYSERFPAILVTSWSNEDAALMRNHRHRIPVLISRDNFDVESIPRFLEICVREINGEILPHRKPWRTLFRVEGTRKIGRENMVDVIIPAWNPNEGVSFPLQLIPVKLRNQVKVGQRFFAKVNTGAENSADLFFSDFEIASKPKSNEQYKIQHT
jgi:hypothetical protein